MALIDRYIFRLTGVGFVVAVGALTGVIWVTQALRDLGLFTNEGQSLFVFLKLIALLLPAMIGLIAPIALFIAIIQTLQRLNADSELVVMSAAGISHLRLLRPVLLLTCAVALIVGFVTLWAAPASYRDWRDLITSARAEFVSRVVREGQFNKIDNGIVFHYRERLGEALMGLFIQDRRDPELTIIYVAERGQIIESEAGTFLVLLDGSVQRETPRAKDASIIGFKRYALDLALLAPNSGETSYRPRERSTTDLLTTVMSGRVTRAERGMFLSELTERASTPLYSFVFALIALAAFARPRSMRERMWLVMASTITCALIARLGGFALAILIQQKPDLFWTALAYPVGISFLACLVLIWRPTFRRPSPRRALA